MKNKAKVIFEFPNDFDNKYNIQCHHNAIDLNNSIYEALQEIRSKLKHGQPTEEEQEFLQKIREILSEFYVEG